MVKKKAKMVGSMTVEAAFIGTMIIFLMVILIYMAFYMHNVTVAKNGGAYLGDLGVTTALKWIYPVEKSLDVDGEYTHILNESWSMNKDKYASVIKNQGMTMLNGQMLGGQVTHIEMAYTYSQVLSTITCIVKVVGQVNMPISVFGIKTMSFSITKTTKEIDATKWIWKKDQIIKAVGTSD